MLDGGFSTSSLNKQVIVFLGPFNIIIIIVIIMERSIYVIIFCQIWAEEGTSLHNI